MTFDLGSLCSNEQTEYNGMTKIEKKSLGAMHEEAINKTYEAYIHQ